MLKGIAVAALLMCVACDLSPEMPDAACEEMCMQQADSGVYGLCNETSEFDQCVIECTDAQPAGSWCAPPPTCEDVCMQPAGNGVYGICYEDSDFDQCVLECTNGWPAGNYCIRHW